jgi:two-component system OmpR family sensor kinase
VFRSIRRPPLFLRIFLVILAAVVGAQLLNFALLLIVRLPEPQVYMLNNVAAHLRSGESTRDMTVATAEPPSPDGQDFRDLRVRDRLGAILHMPRDKIIVAISRPPQWKAGKEIDERKAIHLTKPFAPTDPGEVRDPQFIVGSFTAAIELPDGRWRVARPVSSGIEPWQWQALLWFGGTILLVAPVAWVIARRVAAPVRLFADAAERLGRDPAAPELDIHGPPEIVDAASAFNAMQGRLQRYVEDRTTMVAAIAHDLRTPLMRLGLFIEDLPPPTRSAAEGEIREMKGRINSILAFMRDVNKPARRQKLKLRSLVESVVDAMADQGADVAIEDGEDITLDADVAGLRALFTNIIENAVIYGGEAQVRLDQADGHARIHVIDHGAGLPETEFEKVFTPFYRVEGSRSRETGGNGLGLASARAVARTHGGDITLTPTPGGGLTATISLPI